MKVNIVYSEQGSNNVLDRMAQALASGNGWNYSKNPQVGYDVNHFICYIELAENYSDWHLTSTSCWFTHKETEQQWKLFWWEVAAQNVDIRITAARQYMDELQGYGLTALCPHPPIDPQFTVGEGRARNARPRVGVSGFVHPGGRKGERLVAKLGGSDLGRRVDVVAAGRGWPCQVQLYDWADLPEWYRSLDVFLCTSSIEGIPMPPLEALACGVPVVIPEGVGLLDDLHGAGVYRYPVGDFGKMKDAIEQALTGSADRVEIAAGVAEYVTENWALEHRSAFIDLKAAHKTESDRHGARGVVYVAYGEPSRRCAQGAIASFKKYMPGIPVALISKEPLGCEDVFIQCDDVDIGGRYAKTMIYDLAPREWQYVAYLDADTEVCADASFLFDVLSDGWDMFITKNPAKYHLAWQMRRSDNADECAYTFDQLGTGELVQLNGGVFAFQRNERTAAFFRGWHSEWQRWGKRDQGALLRSLFKNPVKLYVAENYPWNTITRYDSRQGAVIRHYVMTARRWRGKVKERSDSKEAWEAVQRFEQGG